MLKQLASELIKELESNGYEAFFVGGCVRDWLMNRPVHDIDICTNAHPCDVSRIFPNHIPTGLKHGTISVKHGGHLFEVTTYRTEGKYSDNRRPDEVMFVADLTEDLARRDFTMNAIAMSRTGEVIDPFNGQSDLDKKIIRAVGDPATRFQEDALRLLRAVRFAAQLGFTIEEKTKQGMEVTAVYLSRIAMERIRDEVLKMFASDYPLLGFETVNKTSLLQVFPLLHNLFQMAESQVWRLVHVPSIQQKVAFVCFAGLKDQAAADTETICQFIRLSNKDRDSITNLVTILSRLKPVWDHPHSIEWGPLLVKYGQVVCEQVDVILQAIWWRNRDGLSTKRLTETYQEMPIHHLKELAISGLELQQAFDRKKGEWIGCTLHYLVEQVALHHLPNTPEELLMAARKEVEKNEHQTGDIEGVS
ncbi:CCA tRNA nucleotidyltransferase [Brevibacillus ginsengisoli]|uniref:CCA tRNA nucleotidyltransferase n=1 Tax=Brevibacillus ginsengisoli TaxID=363854 RepID=UPI003CE7A8B7